MSKSIREYWPEYYDNILDFLTLAETEDIEIQDLGVAINQLLNDQFVLTSGYGAIKRREKMLGIQADPTTETLDFRKKRIINRYSIKPPFTIRYLQRQLDLLVGMGMTVVSVDSHEFILTIAVSIDNASIFREVHYTVEAIKPANLRYQQNTSLENPIEVDEHISMRLMTWNYKLNRSWKLGGKPFVSYGTEVVAK